MAFANDGRAVSVHRDPDPGDIDREEAPAVFAGEHTARFEGLSVPAVESEDSIGFRDRVPAFDVGELAAIGLARADMTADPGCAAAPAPVLLRSPSPCPHAQNRFWVGEGHPSNFGAVL